MEIWSPHFSKNVQALERKKRMSRMKHRLGVNCCAERLDKFGLSSLERRRLRGDLIELYLIMRGMDRVDWLNIFPQGQRSVLKGKEVGGIHHRCAGMFYTHGVVGPCNLLPRVLVEIFTLVAFRRPSDRQVNTQ